LPSSSPAIVVVGEEEVEELQAGGAAEEGAEAGEKVFTCPFCNHPGERRVPHRPQAGVRGGVVPPHLRRELLHRPRQPDRAHESIIDERERANDDARRRRR